MLDFSIKELFSQRCDKDGHEQPPDLFQGDESDLLELVKPDGKEIDTDVRNITSV